ncbi:MAG: hypothetical protein GF331_03685 [Chitinivibrionales bacterium]|nr:hypothetical protein [Chitinivibrionales bacterium]
MLAVSAASMDERWEIDKPERLRRNGEAVNESAKKPLMGNAAGAPSMPASWKSRHTGLLTHDWRLTRPKQSTIAMVV